jgi:hypothetical protein
MANKLKKVDEHGAALDIQIAAGMTTIGLLNEQGLQSIQQVLQGSNDPAKALAHVIFLALSKVRQALQQKKIEIDDKVWIMGGGVLDRVMYEVMIALSTIIKYPQAHDPNFVHQVKSDVLDLMDDDDNNSESMKVLHDKGLPMPKIPQGAGQQDQQQGGGQQQPQGLAMPQQGAQ